MREKAYIFFTLLNESYRLDAEKRLEDITVITIPHLKQIQASEIVNSYKQQAGDILELLDSEPQEGDLDKLKRALQ